MGIKLVGPFRGRQKPVHIGMYSRQHPDGGRVYSHWNGLFWGQYAQLIEEAFRTRNTPSVYQELKWYGIERQI
jgi:hypothetical protein